MCTPKAQVQVLRGKFALLEGDRGIRIKWIPYIQEMSKVIRYEVNLLTLVLGNSKLFTYPALNCKDHSANLTSVVYINMM